MGRPDRRQQQILPGIGIGVKVLTKTVKDKHTGKIKVISDIAGALRSFKKEVKQSGKLQELRERRYHIGKSEKNREKMERAKYFQWVSDINAD